MNLRSVLSLLLALTIHAATAEDEARELFREANRLAQAGEHARALERFRAAFALYPNPKIHLNIATTLRMLDQNAEAIDHYEKFLIRVGSEVEEDTRRQVEEVLASLKTRVGSLFVTATDGAEILLDGRPVGKAPLDSPLWVEPGTHRIEAHQAHCEFASREASAEAGQTVRVTLEAKCEAPASIARPNSDSLSVAATHTPSLSHASQVGFLARLDGDRKLRGGAVAIGPTFAPMAWLELGAFGLLGPEKGARASAIVYFRSHATVKPFFTLGIPVFFVDGARVGVHGGAGAQWDFNRWFGVLAEVAVEYFPSVPVGFEKALFVPSVGAQARL